jgi:hypothetical protein
MRLRPAAHHPVHNSATPATIKVTPRIVSRFTSSEAENARRLRRSPWREARVRMTATATMAAPTDPTLPETLPPSATAPSIGRATAMARSSNTRIDRTTGVSRFPVHPRSTSSFATTPDEEMYVMPPRYREPTGPEPTSKPTR